MIQLILFISFGLSLLSIGAKAFNQRLCLSLLTQFQIERELIAEVQKSYSLKKKRIALHHLVGCHSPIENLNKHSSRNFFGQKIYLSIGGKLGDSK